mmetsp:Transcript_18473/g.44144  ORF Transcript_18473/g.44144 Transcript_18473/m.44144 type:complete len:505 (-) Transcript_18473:876-2390(-)
MLLMELGENSILRAVAVMEGPARSRGPPCRRSGRWFSDRRRRVSQPASTESSPRLARMPCGQERVRHVVRPELPVSVHGQAFKVSPKLLVLHLPCFCIVGNFPGLSPKRLLDGEDDVLLRDVRALRLAVSAVNQDAVERLELAARERPHVHLRLPVLGCHAPYVPACDYPAVPEAPVAHNVAHAAAEPLRRRAHHATHPVMLLSYPPGLCLHLRDHREDDLLVHAPKRLDALRARKGGLGVAEPVERDLGVKEQVLRGWLECLEDLEHLPQRAVVLKLTEYVHQVGAHPLVDLVLLHRRKEARRTRQPDRRHELKRLLPGHDPPAVKAVNKELIRAPRFPQLRQEVAGHPNGLEPEPAALSDGALNDGQRYGDASPAQQHLVQEGVADVVVVVAVPGEAETVAVGWDCRQPLLALAGAGAGGSIGRVTGPEQQPVEHGEQLASVGRGGEGGGPAAELGGEVVQEARHPRASARRVKRARLAQGMGTGGGPLPGFPAPQPTVPPA